MNEEDYNQGIDSNLEQDIQEKNQQYLHNHHSYNDLAKNRNIQFNHQDLNLANIGQQQIDSDNLVPQSTKDNGANQIYQTHRQLGGEQSHRRNLLSGDNLGGYGNQTQTLSQIKSMSSLNTTPNNMNRSSRTPVNANRNRDSSQHSSIRKAMLSENINKKEEDLLQRLSNLQSLGVNQALQNKGNQNASSDNNLPHTMMKQDAQYKSKQDANQLSPGQNVILSPNSFQKQQQFEVVVRQSDDSRRFIDRLKDQYLNVSNQSSAKKSPVKSLRIQDQQQDMHKSQSSPYLYSNCANKRIEISQKSNQKVQNLPPQIHQSPQTKFNRQLYNQEKDISNQKRALIEQVDHDINDDESLLQDLDYIEEKQKKTNQDSNRNQRLSLNKDEFNQQFRTVDQIQAKNVHQKHKPMIYQHSTQEHQTFDDRDLIKEIEENKRMFEEMESTLGMHPQHNLRQMAPQYPNMQSQQFMEQALKKKVKRGSKQKNLDENKKRKQSVQPLSPQQRGTLNQRQENQELHSLEQERLMQENNSIKNRKKWIPNEQSTTHQSMYPAHGFTSVNTETDRVMFEFQNQGSQQQWAKINELLTRIKFEKIDLDQRSNQYGPIEQSVIQSLYSLIRQVQTLNKRLDAGDFDENQKLEKELNASKDLILKLEQTIFKLEQKVENSKHQDKKENLNSQKSQVTLEKKIKDMTNKILVCENTVQQKQLEIDMLRKKLEKRLSEDDKYQLRDRQTFEKFFGKQPRASEEKYVNFLRAFENQRERNEKQMELLEREVQRLNTLNLELQNENYGLSKGQLPAEEAHYFKRGDGALSLQIKELEEQNYKLQQALKSNSQDYKDLLIEIDKQKSIIIEREQQMQGLEQELKFRPNLANIKATEYKVQNMEKEICELQRQNNELHNELIQIRNDQGSHLSDQGKSQHSKSANQNISDNVGKKGGLILKSSNGHYLSAGDAKLVIEEITEILKLENNDPVQIIETIRKLEKVVKAVPRMESFIQNICKATSEDPNQLVSIEQVIPKLKLWKDIVLNQFGALQQLKRDLIYLIFQRDNIQLMNGDVYKEVERIIIEKEHLKTQAQAETESQRTFTYLLELFEASESHSLVEKVNQTFVYVNEFNTFMRIVRGILHMDQSMTVTTCLNVIRGIVQQYVQAQMNSQSQQQMHIQQNHPNQHQYQDPSNLNYQSQSILSSNYSQNEAGNNMRMGMNQMTPSQYQISLPQGWEYDRSQSKLNLEDAKRVYQMYEFPEQKILAKLVHESPLFEPYVDVEDPREEERQNLNEQLKALHSEILKRGIFTAQQIIDDPEKFLISQQVKRDLPTSFLIKQNVHFGLYMKTLKNLGTEKHMPYVERAAKLEDLCCFCMTELAHGSNVQGIKTTATYDPSTREFVLNTPTDQDMKFWIGNLAKTATHGVVFAQLYTLGKNQGVHPFVVHLRDPKNHQPYPGLLIGDCGAKIGHHGIDNGFIKFSSYRISKDALLDKYFQVADDGTYTSEIPTKGKRFAFVLSSLSFGRTMMAHGSINYALYFLSTVLRYGHLRRQFSSDMKIDAKENTLMSYQLYQFRIVPRLARNLFFRFGMDEVTQMYFDQRVKSLDPKYHGSKMFHALITFCKSHISTSIQRDTEESRQALGGLGYSHYSEIGMMLTDNDVNLTWEGDNKVLLQQTAKFVLKNCYNTMQGKPLQAQELTYLKEYFEDIDDFKSKITEDMRNSQNILRIFRCITAQTSFKSLMNMQQQMQNKGMYQAYLESLPFNQNVLSIMFGETFFIEAYLRRLENFKDQETRQVFEKILYLWASYTIVDRAGEFRDQDFLSSEHIETCKQTVLELIAELKHELIPLTEIQDYIYTNVFSQPDAYDRFLGKVNQAQGVFGKIQNTDFVLLKNE